MSLAKLLENKFRGDIRHRGAAYIKAGRVSITKVTPDNIFAVVRDGSEHQTQLTRQDGDLKMFCSSVEGTSKPPTTKYLWATILAVDEGEYLSAAPRPGDIPPFVSDSPDYQWSDDDWIEGLDDLEYGGPTAEPSAKKSAGAVETKRKRKDWELKLNKLRDDLKSGHSAGSDSERDSEIFYEIDVAASQQAETLIVQTSQRQRRTNGEWGKLKPLKLRPGQFDHIVEEIDQRILSYLFGGMPERGTASGSANDRQPQAFRYRLAYGLCELILPLMCSTRRVRFVDSAEKNWIPLQWDDAPPWDLCLRMDFDESDKKWKLLGELRREDAVLPAERARLLLPGGLVFTDDKIARMTDFDAFSWLPAILEGDSLSADEGDEVKFVDTLLDLPVVPRLELPEELRLEEVRVEPKPFLSVHTPEKKSGWKYSKIQADVEFDYDDRRISASSNQWAVVQRDEGRCLVRNRETEREFWSVLQQVGFHRLIDRRYSKHDVEIASHELGPAIRKLIDAGWQVQASGHQVRRAGSLKFRINSGIDWFGLSGDVDFDGETVAFPELLSALVRGDTTIRLSDGSLGIVPEEWQQQYGLLAGLGEQQEDEIRFSATQVGLLDALLATQDDIDYDEKFLSIRERLNEQTSPTEKIEPEEFEGELRAYQRDGLGWLKFLEDFHFGGCLADDMGLGKTVQVLALLLNRKLERKAKSPSIVVVPKSLMFNWYQEAHRFTPQLKVMEYTGVDREPLRKEFKKQDLILTTYGTLRRDIVHLKDMAFDYAVLDEAQTIKNSNSQIAKASRLLRADHRLALSGTPIENHLGDLWSIFEFLNPGMLGRSSVFKTATANVEDETSRTLLARGLRPFVLRRTKREVASELPEKFEETIYCEMSEEQEKLYNELRDHYRESLMGMVKTQGIGKTKMHVLEALLRLRQAACHPALMDRSTTEEPFAKIEALVPMVQELLEEGHKALIFSQFTSMLSIVKEHFDKNDMKYLYLDGQTRNRQEVVEQFQNDDEAGVFLISLKAGGLGLNLTAAGYVFLLDPWWNPAVEAQAIDRAHRVGQTRQVFAYRMICRGTVEEKIAELQNKKKKLADAILEQDNSVMKDLTTDDLQMLLS